MGKKKSRRNKKNINKNGPLRNEQLQIADATPAAPALVNRDTSSNLFHQVGRFADVQNCDEIRKLESKHRHLVEDSTFSNDKPFEAKHILRSFGIAYQEADKSEDNEDYRDRAIHYFKRAKEVIDSIQDDRFQVEIRGLKLVLMTIV